MLSWRLGVNLLSNVSLVIVSSSNSRHFIHSEIVMEIYRSKCIHHGIVEKLQVLSFSKIEQVFREEDMQDSANKHMNNHKDDKWIELAWSPVKCEKLECQKSGNDLHQHVKEHGNTGAWGNGDVQQHVLPD